MSRRFSLETKGAALRRAGNRCQVCGSTEVDCYYIHSKKQRVKWARAGGCEEKWMEDRFIRSLDNCVVLCDDCGDYTYSEEGLQKVTVQYLESLNQQSGRCTVPLPGGRCPNRIAGEGSYRCQDHLEY